MVDIGVHAGDLVLVKKTNVANDGQVIVVLTEEGNTLKRLHYENGKPVLYAENSSYTEKAARHPPERADDSGSGAEGYQRYRLMHNIEAKTILSAKNGMNLYRGCTHGCIYCDSRSNCYGMDHEFEDVAVKSNAIELLEDALRRKRKPYINDTVENLNGILDYCFDAGVKGIINFGFGVTLRAGNREYFYRKLDEHFPGMKECYICRFGVSYECASENSAALWKVFADRCRKAGVMTSPDEIFAYLREYPVRNEQLSLYD